MSNVQVYAHEWAARRGLRWSELTYTHFSQIRGEWETAQWCWFWSKFDFWAGLVVALFWCVPVLVLFWAVCALLVLLAGFLGFMGTVERTMI